MYTTFPLAFTAAALTSSGTNAHSSGTLFRNIVGTSFGAVADAPSFTAADVLLTGATATLTPLSSLLLLCFRFLDCFSGDVMGDDEAELVAVLSPSSVTAL